MQISAFLAAALLLAGSPTAQEALPGTARPAAAPVQPEPVDDFAVRIPLQLVVDDPGTRWARPDGGHEWRDRKIRWKAHGQAIEHPRNLQTWAAGLLADRSNWHESKTQPGTMIPPVIAFSFGAGVRFNDVVQTIDAILAAGLRHPVLLTGPFDLPMAWTQLLDARAPERREDSPFIDPPRATTGHRLFVDTAITLEVAQTGPCQVAGEPLDSLEEIAAWMRELRRVCESDGLVEEVEGPNGKFVRMRASLPMRIDRWTEWARIEPILRLAISEEIAFPGIQFRLLEAREK